jgi:hypothetical protein
MFSKRHQHFIGLALALGVGAAGFVHGAEGGMTKDAFRAAEKRLESQAKAQRKACARLKGNAKEVCEVQAKGWETVAKAYLQARLEPGPEAEKEAKFARADADYAVARQRCASLKDPARDKCVDRAKHDREAAMRLAKVEKVEELNALKREEAQERKQAQQKPAPKS